MTVRCGQSRPQARRTRLKGTSRNLSTVIHAIDNSCWGLSLDNRGLLSSPSQKQQKQRRGPSTRLTTTTLGQLRHRSTFSSGVGISRPSRQDALQSTSHDDHHQVLIRPVSQSRISAKLIQVAKSLMRVQPARCEWRQEPPPRADRWRAFCPKQ